MTKPKFYAVDDAQKAVSAAIDNTSIDDEFVDNYYKAALEVLTGKGQTRSSTSIQNLDLKVLESLLQLARKKLDAQPTNENKQPKKNTGNSVVSNTPTTSSTLNDKSIEKSEKSKKSVKSSKKKSIEEEETMKMKEETAKKKEETSKKKEKEVKRKKMGELIEVNVTVRKKRRKLNDILQQEAREQVFGGSKDVDSEALSSAVKEVLQPTPSIKTRSKSSNSLRAITWKERDYSPTTTTTTASSSALVPYKNVKNTKPVENSQDQEMDSGTIIPSTSNNNNNNELVHYKAKPKISKKASAIPLPSVPHEDVTIPATFEANGKDKFQNRPVPTNPRWQEFPTVIEQLIDEVLTFVHFRADTEDKKAQMRSGILDIILFEVTAIKASKDRNLGVTTVRKYCRDVKVRLECVLGNDVADEKFFENLKDKENMTVEQLKEAIIEYKKKKESIIEETIIEEDDEEEEDTVDHNNKIVEKDNTFDETNNSFITTTTTTGSSKKVSTKKPSTSSDLNKSSKSSFTKEEKRPSSIQKIKTTKVHQEEEEKERQKSVVAVVIPSTTTTAISTKNNNNVVVAIPPPSSAPPLFSSSSSRKILDGKKISNKKGGGQQQENLTPINWGLTKPLNNNNKMINNRESHPFDICDSSTNNNNTLSILNTIKCSNNSSSLLTVPKFERKPLKGTKGQIKENIKEYLAGKYSGGSVDQFAEMLSTYIEAELRLKRMMNNFDIPLELFRSGYILISRYFKVEEAELFSDNEEEEEEN